MAEKYPELFGSILIFGSDTRFGDYSEAATQIGGWMRTPQIGLSYLFSAHRLLRSAGQYGQLGEVALPVRHLQRHALELQLKETINTAYAVCTDEAFLAALRGNPQAPWPERKFANDKTHNLEELVKELDLALTGIDEGKTPDDVRDMAARITRLEAGKPDRWRYLTLKRLRHKSRQDFPDQSLPTPRIMRLGEMQVALEEIFRRNFWIRDRDHQLSDSASHFAGMALRSENLDYAIHPVLERAGRGGASIELGDDEVDERDM